MENTELIIKVVEKNKNASVEIKGYGSDRMLIAVLKDIIEILFERRYKQILNIQKG